MNVLLDANILVRIADLSAPLRPTAMAAVSSLKAQGHTLCIVPQSLYEFWVVATRPLDKNGLGLSVPECIGEITTLRSYYQLLLDPVSLYVEWENLVSSHACRGKVAHDARYVAAMNRHGVTNFLTFNGGDFARYSGLTLLDPHTIGTSTTPIITTL